MPTTRSDDDKKRRDPHDAGRGSAGKEQDGGVEGDDAAELDDDQADSGPDRDHKQFGDR